jgi:hypothetical protein
MSKLLPVTLLLLLAGCLDYSVASNAHHSHNQRLLIVVPAAWKPTLAGYIYAKKQDGFLVQVLEAEDVVKTLADEIQKAAPDYVFLVGDQSLIPTVYRCSNINWSDAYGTSCTYSDYWLANGGAVVGRLLTHSLVEVNYYVLKALAYRARFPSRRAYLINDRVYDYRDYMVLTEAETLEKAGITTKVDAVNIGENSFLVDGAGESSPVVVASEIDQGVDVIGYYGHGAAPAWGYNYNIYRDYITPAAGSVIPLVISMACETARNAPNPPWYPYAGVDGAIHVIPPGPPAVTSIPEPSPIQPAAVLGSTMASRFTTDLPSGSMVYVGETVVTGAEFGVLNAFYSNVASAYATPTATIGDIIQEAIGHGRPELWQVVGDPSTWFN